MPNSEIPTWFPLSIHRVAPSTYEHWIRAITFRLAIIHAPQSNEWKRETYTSVVIEDSGVEWSKPNPLNFLGVRELTPYQSFVIAGFHERSANSEAKALAARALAGQHEYTKEADEIRRRTPEPQNDESFWYDEFMYRIPVMVDLAVDDETLVSHFEFWLQTQRAFAKEMGLDTTFPVINEATLQHWHKFRLLAGYDLMVWREISDATYTDAQIAASLWPDSGAMAEAGFVDRVERFRKVTKPLIKRMMDFYTVERLERQWEWNLMREKMEAERNEKACK